MLDAGAPLLVSANPGCTLQIAAALADRGEHVALAHIAEILDASLRGLPPPVAAPPDGPGYRADASRQDAVRGPPRGDGGAGG